MFKIPQSVNGYPVIEAAKLPERSGWAWVVIVDRECTFDPYVCWLINKEGHASSGDYCSRLDDCQETFEERKRQNNLYL